ncbi:YeiH family protein [Croceimicrobium hydrocarbonivorans]|nr:putative sulfate exporter family transporter [Croceimicrobium hydrocarbonivorans]
MKKQIGTPLFLILLILSLSPWIGPPLAMVLGFLYQLIFPNPLGAKNKDAINWSLKSAVVGLGFGINANQALASSSEGLVLTIFSIASTLLLGWILGKALKLNFTSSYLLSSGTAICGGSAIAAMSPILKAEEKDISMALGTVFLLNSVALLIFPSIGTWLNLSQVDFGTWAAIAIHDTSSVVGAAAAYGEEALEIATTIKLVRALWIIPLALITSLFLRKGGKIKFPYFILLFLAAMLLNTFVGLPQELSGGISMIARRILTATLFLVGAGISIEKIKSAGWRALLLGLLLWLFIGIGSLTAILYI